MASQYTLAVFLCLALFASSTNARKEPGKYRQDVTKDQPIPQLVQDLVHVSKVTSSGISDKGIDCHESDKASTTKYTSSFTKELKPNDEKSFTKDFEPRPNISAYTDDVKTEDGISFAKDFEPRPNISAYTDDVKTEDGVSFAKDFEPRPNISAYTDDDDKSFTKDFEPRPNISAYNDDGVGEKAEKADEKDFKPRENFWVYQV